MTDRAMRIRMFHAWQNRPEGPYQIVSASSEWHVQKFIYPGAGDFITEQDVWVEIPERPSP